jgi:hypothetical protein
MVNCLESHSHLLKDSVCRLCRLVNYLINDSVNYSVIQLITLLFFQLVT